MRPKIRPAVIASTAAPLALVLSSSAMANGNPRFDLLFSDVDVFPNTIDPTAQVTTTGDPGRYFAAFGWSNVDVDVCWNGGSSYTGWASEVAFAMTMDDGTGTALFGLDSPFAGDYTGADTPNTCSNRQALAEVQTDFSPFTYAVDASGDVISGIYSIWADGTGLRHSHCNTADFFFVLSGPIPAGCDGATGSCVQVHDTPGCNDISCCAVTCDVNSGGDSFCCDVEWDSTCVDLAVALCGLFAYSCEAPAYANDCVSGATMMANGDTIAFDTTGANTDGPDQAQCGSAYEDLPIWSDLWYMIEVEGDGSEVNMVATCCNTAVFDTKIAIYDAGALGSSFDPATLPQALLTCNEDCAADAGTFYTSEATASVPSGNQYLIRIGGYLQSTGTGDLTISWIEPEPPLAAPSCTTPGGTTITQFTADPDSLNISSGLGCGAGAENVVARTYSAVELGGAFDVSCVDFGYFYNDEGYFPCVINLYRSNKRSPVGATLELLDTTSCGIYGVAGYTIGSQSFDTPVNVDLADGEYLMVEIRLQRQLADNAGTGYGGYFGCLFADTNGTEGYISCGGDYFGTLSEIGFPDYQPYIVFNGNPGPGPCSADFNGDGAVRAADLGLLLGAWGTDGSSSPGVDLNGDGLVDATDLGILIGQWGPCP